MALQFFDHDFDPSLSEELVQLQFDHRLRHPADRQQHDDHAKQNQERVEDPARTAESTNLAIAHRGHGRQGHVECVEDRVVFDQDKADRATRERERHRDGDKRQAAPQVIHVFILNGNWRARARRASRCRCAHAR